ncbi:cytochrome o ubiquinol oxidase subunit IV [Rhizobium sp. S95]|uniref:Cytochrome bo(3) ubiquinol oxidase subunit 4 n=1 Tax=Ciceribacter sichuanensis TaxID=2949647 RepID=A0AAJ1BSN5_9HYPH|nr:MULTISPECIES: cytochrome o ubiquinol oxidase subunit IV [unclassified Ciceribacter]MCM2395001.1 cytochrome o ubiquinol oxidase subunit IV [Ciceribacter sp. S95]MCO5955423.1 cytochrome o ubiquinol oxidase subunit IV [Ciceribacter sp. S101]
MSSNSHSTAHADHAHGGHDSHGDHGGHGSHSTLMIGFALAAILTIIPFGLVMAEVEISKTAMIAIIMGLGAVQVIVHLIYFLHLNNSQEEGWTMASTMLTVIILMIVLAGSLWVMHNMNANMMPMGNDAMQQVMGDGETTGIAPEPGTEHQTH